MECVLRMAAVAALLASVAAASGPACPSGVKTTCSSNQTCCRMTYSHSGYGCSTLGADAVCCDTSQHMPTGDPIQNACPAGHSCVQTGLYSATCVPPPSTPPQPNVSATAVCPPGPEFHADDSSANPKALPSVIILGDSVSIGYTGNVVSSLQTSNVAFVQHSPWAGGGGAASTSNGVMCMESFLRAADYTPQQWDLIAFNFGLHDTSNATSAEALYAQNMELITARLNATGAKLLYMLTTPMMLLYNQGNHAVEKDNAAAKAIMAKYNIPILDLHAVITAHCGKEYTTCNICKVEPCSYHYNAAGYTLLGDAVSAAISQQLKE